jgi:hypothetical protein
VLGHEFTPKLEAEVEFYSQSSFHPFDAPARD